MKVLCKSMQSLHQALLLILNIEYQAQPKRKEYLKKQIKITNTGQAQGEWDAYIVEIESGQIK